MTALDGQWRTSTRSSGGGACVQVRLVDGRIEVRDTKLGEASPILGFTAAEWGTFLGGTRHGHFDR